MKKVWSCLLAFCLIFSCFAINTSAFQDVRPTAWYYEAVEYMKDAGIVEGYDDGTFKHNGWMTRGDFAVILSRCAADFKAPDTELPFVDVQKGAYYADAICWAYTHGLVNGVSETLFNPNRNITREQAVKIVWVYVKASGRNMETTPSEKQFTDRDTVSTWAKEAMDWAIDSGFINGDNEGRLLPKSNMTRGQLCVMLYNAREIIIGAELS